MAMTDFPLGLASVKLPKKDKKTSIDRFIFAPSAMARSFGSGQMSMTFASGKFVVSPPAKHATPRAGKENIAVQFSKSSGSGSLPSMFIPKRAWGKYVKKAGGLAGNSAKQPVSQSGNGAESSGTGTVCIDGQCFWEQAQQRQMIGEAREECQGGCAFPSVPRATPPLGKGPSDDEDGDEDPDLDYGSKMQDIRMETRQPIQTKTSLTLADRGEILVFGPRWQNNKNVPT